MSSTSKSITLNYAHSCSHTHAHTCTGAVWVMIIIFNELACWTATKTVPWLWVTRHQQRHLLQLDLLWLFVLKAHSLNYRCDLCNQTWNCHKTGTLQSVIPKNWTRNKFEECERRRGRTHICTTYMAWVLAAACDYVRRLLGSEFKQRHPEANGVLRPEVSQMRWQSKTTSRTLREISLSADAELVGII